MGGLGVRRDNIQEQSALVSFDHDSKRPLISTTALAVQKIVILIIIRERPLFWKALTNKVTSSFSLGDLFLVEWANSPKMKTTSTSVRRMKLNFGENKQTNLH